MTDISEKLKAFDEEEEKLAKRKAKVLDKWKEGIGKYAEKFGLFNAPDTAIVGLLLEGKKIIDDNGDRLEELKAIGARFLNKRHDGKATSKNPSTT